MGLIEARGDLLVSCSTHTSGVLLLVVAEIGGGVFPHSSNLVEIE